MNNILSILLIILLRQDRNNLYLACHVAHPDEPPLILFRGIPLVGYHIYLQKPADMHAKHVSALHC